MVQEVELVAELVVDPAEVTGGNRKSDKPPVSPAQGNNGQWKYGNEAGRHGGQQGWWWWLAVLWWKQEDLDKEGGTGGAGVTIFNYRTHQVQAGGGGGGRGG